MPFHPIIPPSDIHFDIFVTGNIMLSKGKMRQQKFRNELSYIYFCHHHHNHKNQLHLQYHQHLSLCRGKIDRQSCELCICACRNYFQNNWSHHHHHHLHHCYVSQNGEITITFIFSQCGEGEVRNMSSPTECQEAPQFHLDYSNPWCIYNYQW